MVYTRGRTSNLPACTGQRLGQVDVGARRGRLLLRVLKEPPDQFGGRLIVHAPMAADHSPRTGGHEASREGRSALQRPLRSGNRFARAQYRQLASRQRELMDFVQSKKPSSSGESSPLEGVNTNEPDNSAVSCSGWAKPWHEKSKHAIRRSLLEI